MKNLLQEIKTRKIRKWLAIYISAAITSIGVIHLISIRYSWPPNYVFDIIFFTLLFGIFSIGIIAWFHGNEGRQKIRITEIVLHSILVILLCVTLFFKIDFGQKQKENFNKKIIAVLPFANFNETAETEFFADGITEDVLTQLSKISDLKVISRTSVMKYKNTAMNISDISKELGAGSILEGSVRTSGNKLRIVGQLIDANSDVHIWSETYDREMKDIFDIQSDIAERIAAALNAKLLPLEIKLMEKNNTKSIDAYTFYLKGKHHYFNYTEEENEKAIELFKKALKIDSNYALALAGLSDSYGQKVTKYWSTGEWMDSALTLGKKAVALNPDLPEAFKALASAYEGKEEVELALANYKIAIELNPNYWSAILSYGQLKMFTGYFDQALYWIRRANVLAPDDIMGVITVSKIYKNLGCDRTAIIWAKKALSLAPEHKFVNTYLGDLYLNIGDFSNASKYFEHSIDIDSNWAFGWFLGGRFESILKNYEKAKDNFDRYMEITDTYPEYFYAHTLIKLNQKESAKVILNEEIKDYTTYFAEEDYNIFNYMAFAEIYAINNDRVNAFKWWRKAINKGYTDLNRMKIYPYFENLRGEPKYKVLLEKMQTKIDSFKFLILRQFPDYAECQ